MQLPIQIAIFRLGITGSNPDVAIVAIQKSIDENRP